ncbi:MAG: hypothetical protein LUQ65_11660, partial [Candidatus Helarchaeota archaeon]|nr:hypothetical protein [Candidatus Helarchaeota archaeon]
MNRRDFFKFLGLSAILVPFIKNLDLSAKEVPLDGLEVGMLCARKKGGVVLITELTPDFVKGEV